MILKKLVSKEVSDLVSKKVGIEKRIGFGIGQIWYLKKVSDSVSFRFGVSSHTALIERHIECLVNLFKFSNWYMDST